MKLLLEINIYGYYAFDCKFILYEYYFDLCNLLLILELIFRISNLGMFGITEFSAIINPPQCAILAVSSGIATLGKC